MASWFDESRLDDERALASIDVRLRAQNHRLTIMNRSHQRVGGDRQDKVRSHLAPLLVFILPKSCHGEDRLITHADGERCQRLVVRVPFPLIK